MFAVFHVFIFLVVVGTSTITVGCYEHKYFKVGEGWGDIFYLVMGTSTMTVGGTK